MRALKEYTPPYGPIEVLHVDASILVINKPWRLLSVPGRDPAHADSVSQRLLQLWPWIGVVHRLDMDTSGVMVLALSLDSQRHLCRQFEKRQTQKRYVALVSGAPDGNEGEIDAPLICDWPNRPLQKVCWETGKPSQTRWHLDQRGEVSRVTMFPKTGRTHQLRVHMAHIGCPMLGDRFYAPEEVTGAAPRLMLHAEELVIAHPENNETLTFTAPCPF